MGLLDKRDGFYPFEYPEFFDAWHKQKKMFWIVDEISLAADIHDWNQNLTSYDKKIIEQVLKSFTNIEVIVGNYWLKVSQWFGKPEIVMAAVAMGDMETIHQDAYSKLQITLGMDTFDPLTFDAAAKQRLDNLILRQSSLEEKALSLAVFSGFAEGVSLFSQFAVLINFSRFNLMKGLGQIIAFSVRDESHHSQVGAMLFRKIVEEYGDQFWNDDFKKNIYEAARIAVKLEDDFIDYVFSTVESIRDLTPHQLKQYIRYRANTRLNDLGLKTNWKNIDMPAVNALTSWFEPMTLLNNIEHHDFFAVQGTAYAQGVNFDKVFD